MTRKYLWNHKLYIDSLFARSESFQGKEEPLAHWTRYLCVLVSGWLETSVCDIIGDYTQKRSSGYVSHYVSQQLDKFWDPSMDKILALTCDFSPEWMKMLEEATKGEIKAAINSIVSQRNLIAHGESSSISYEQLKKYYQKAIEGIQILESQCNK